MAVTTWSSKAALVKAILLPFTLVLLAMAAGASSSTEDGVAVAESGGRFSTETTVGRKLLSINLCGSGTAPNFGCALLLPFASKPACCSGPLGNQICLDVGGYLFSTCGSCTTSCTFGQLCCKGACRSVLTDKSNCGFCGNICSGTTTCTLGFCK